MAKFSDLQARVAASGSASAQPQGLSALKDPIFLAKMRRFYRDYKGRDFADDSEMIRHWRTDQTWSAFNIADMAMEAIGGMNDEEDERVLKRDLKSVYDQIPKTFEDDGGAIAAAMILDPTNLVGGGQVKAGVSALRGGAGMAKAATKAFASGALREGAVNAGIGAGADLIEQSRDVELGLEEDIDLGETGQAAIVSGALGAGLGGTIAAGGTAIVGKKVVAKQVEALTALGYNAEEISAMSSKAVDDIIKGGLAKVQEAAPVAAAPEEAAPAVEEPTAEDKELVGLNKQIEVDTARLAAIRADYMEKLRIYQRDGLDGSDDAVALRNAVAEMSSLSRLPQRIAEAKDSVAPNFDKNDLPGERRAQEQIKRLADLENLYANTLENPSPERFAALNAKAKEALVAKGKAKAKAVDPTAPAAAGPSADPVTSSEAAPAAEVTPAAPNEVTPPTKKTRTKKGATPAQTNEFEAADAETGDALYSALETHANEASPGAFAKMKAHPAFEQAIRSNAGERADEVWRYIQTKYLRGGITDQAAEGKKGLSKTERHWLREQTKLEAKMAPDADGKEHYANALAKILAARSPRQRNAPLADYTTKGRTPEGKVQPILKRNTPVGDGRTVIGQAPQIPKRYRVEPATASATPTLATDIQKAEQAARRQANQTIYGRENAVNQAERMVSEAVGENGKGRIRLTQNMQPVEYISAGGDRLIDGGTSYRNQKVWYDPETRASYGKYSNLRAGGTDTLPTPEERASRKLEAARNRANPAAPKPEAAPAPAAAIDDDPDLAFLKEFEAGGFRLDVLKDIAAKAVAQMSANRRAVDLPQVPQRLNSGEVVALRSKENPEQVRVISQGQLDEGKGLADILGPKGDLKDWDVGHSKGKTNSPEAAAAFVAWDANSAPARAVAVNAKPFLTPDEARAPLTNLTSDDRAELTNLLVKGRAIGTGKRDDGITINKYLGHFDPTADITPLDLHQISGVVLRAADWGDARQHAKVVEFLTDFYAFTARVQPTPLRLSTTELADAEAGILRLFNDSPDEAQAAIKIVRDLAKNDRGLPSVYKTREGKPSTYADISNAEGPSVRVSPGQVFPRLPLMLHEMGHWAYQHILSDAERLQFWNGIKKYYDEFGNFDRQAVASRSPTDGRWHENENGKFSVTNELANPNEFFANQFSMWAMQNRTSVLFQDESFWKKVAGYIEATYRRYISKEAIDPDLVPIFERLLPEPKAAVTVKPGGPSAVKLDAHTATGRAIVKNVYKLRLAHDDLKEALATLGTDDERVDSVIAHAQELATALFGAAKFDVLGKTRSVAYDVLDKLDEILGREGTGKAYDFAGSVSNPEATAAKIRALAIEIPDAQGDKKKYGLDDAIELIVGKAVGKFNSLSDEPVTARLEGLGVSFRSKAETHPYRARIIRNVNRKRRGITDRAEEAVVTAASLLSRKGRPEGVADISPANAVDYKRAPISLLAHELERWKDTDYGVQIAQEIAQRTKAKPLDDQAPRIIVRDVAVSKSMRREAEDYKGLTENVGVAPNARATIREAQGALTHRDPEKQSVIRTLFYRMASMAGVADQTQPKVLSSDLIARMAGTEPGKPGMVFADHRTVEFDALRAQLRRVATALTDDVGSPDEGVHRAALMMSRSGVINDDGLLAKVTPEGEDPHEWFATLMGRYLRNEEKPFGATIYSPQLRALAIKHQDAIGYLLNGQIGRREIKARHPLLDNYGPLFGDEGAYEPVVSGRQTAEVVGREARAAWDQAGPGRRSAIRAFVGHGVGQEGGKPITHYVRALTDVDDDSITPWSETPFGPGVRVFIDARKSDTSQTRDISEAVLDHLADVHGPDSDAYVEAAALADELSDASSALSAAHARMAHIDANRRELGADYFAQRSSLRTQITEFTDTYDALLDEMKSRGPVENFGVYPAYVRLTKPLDLTGDLSESADFEAFFNYAEREGLIVENADELVEELLDTDGSEMGSEAAYQWMMRLVDDGTGSEEQVRQMVNTALKDMGYDGVIGRAAGEDYTVLFEASQAKHVKAEAFDDSDFFNGHFDEPEGAQRLGAINAMVAAGGNLDAMPAIVDMMEISGAPKALTSALATMGKHRKLSARENKVIWQASVADRLGGTGAGRLRKAGANWLADWISPVNGTGHFEKVASETGRVLQPISRMLSEMPDASRHLKAWAEKSNPFSNTQPQSHARIVSALRRKPGSDQEANLSAQERKAYDALRAQFDETIKELQAEGVMTGEIKENYFPQVWNRDHILQNQDAFMRLMANYMKREAVRDGRRMDEVTALQKAKSVFDNLTNDDGVFIPPPSSAAGEIVADHIDYQRLIRLDQDQVSLNELEPFLESNLGAVVTKYFDTATRKLEIVKQFGPGAHGWHDYMRVLEDGDEAAIKLLMSNRILKKDLSSFDGENERTLTTLVRETEMPFNNNPQGARDAVDVLNDLLPQGPQAMRNYLMKLGAENVDQTYVKRVEAIVNAMVDRSQSQRLLHADEINHADQLLRAIQRKPIDSAHSANSMVGRTTRAIRNFNSVTLLSYTLLSSLGDIMLPLIRSGDIGAWLKGIKEYARDPEYRQMLKNTGVSIENIIHERMVGLYGSPTSKFTTAFFNATGLAPWTEMMREVSGSVAYEYFKTEYRIAAKNFDPRLPLAAQDRKVKIAYRRLREYGLDSLLAANVNIDTPDAMQIPELRQAIIKFANKTIFSPNPNDLPVAAQTPVGALLYQLKSFPLMMSRLSRDVLKDAGLWSGGAAKGERDYRPLLLLLSAGPAAGAVVMTVKDYAQGRGEENRREPRKRLASEQAGIGDILKAAGVDQNSPEADAFLGWYMESFMMMGGLGLLGDMIHDTASQLDNGAFGAQRVASTVFGPSVGDFIGAFNVAAGVGQALPGGDGGNGKVRQAWRETVSRVPLVGGQRSWREGIVDTLAGEKAEPGGGGGESAGFEGGF